MTRKITREVPEELGAVVEAQKHWIEEDLCLQVEDFWRADWTSVAQSAPPYLARLLAQQAALEEE